MTKSKPSNKARQVGGGGGGTNWMSNARKGVFTEQFKTRKRFSAGGGRAVPLRKTSRRRKRGYTIVADKKAPQGADALESQPEKSSETRLRKDSTPPQQSLLMQDWVRKRLQRSMRTGHSKLSCGKVSNRLGLWMLGPLPEQGTGAKPCVKEPACKRIQSKTWH